MAYNRIQPKIKAIADAHIAAKMAGKFDNPKVSTKEEIIECLYMGKTFSQVLNVIEIRFCSITSLLLHSPALLAHTTHQYKAGVYKGFKIMLQEEKEVNNVN
jgi:hypothetical protein